MKLSYCSCGGRSEILCRDLPDGDSVGVSPGFTPPCQETFITFISQYFLSLSSGDSTMVPPSA